MYIHAEQVASLIMPMCNKNVLAGEVGAQLRGVWVNQAPCIHVRQQITLTAMREQRPPQKRARTSAHMYDSVTETMCLQVPSV